MPPASLRPLQDWGSLSAQGGLWTSPSATPWPARAPTTLAPHSGQAQASLTSASSQSGIHSGSRFVVWPRGRPQLGLPQGSLELSQAELKSLKIPAWWRQASKEREIEPDRAGRAGRLRTGSQAARPTGSRTHEDEALSAHEDTPFVLHIHEAEGGQPIGSVRRREGCH